MSLSLIIGNNKQGGKMEEYKELLKEASRQWDKDFVKWAHCHKCPYYGKCDEDICGME